MRLSSRSISSVILLVTVVVAFPTLPAEAVTCTVPSAPHPTIQAAIDDVGCTDIVVAAGAFQEAVTIARDVSVQGAGSSQTYVQGGAEVSAGTVSLTGMHLSAAGEALDAHSGAEVSGFDLVVVNGTVEPPLFADGFEDGTTDAWAATSP